MGNGVHLYLPYKCLNIEIGDECVMLENSI
jgi:hypothetical protein